MTESLSIVVKRYDVNEAIAQPIIDAFMPHYQNVIALAEQAATLTVTDATQVTEIKRAGELRCAIKQERCGSDAVRKKQKETYLRIGNAIQGVHNTIAGIAEPIEAKLLEMEEFAERAEAARIKKLGEERAKSLEAFGVLQDAFNAETFGKMAQATFDAMAAAYRQQHEAKIKAEAEAKAAAAKAEAARITEARRVSMENARLRREREEAQAVAKKEREARETVERETAAELAAKQKEIDAALAAKVKEESARWKAEADAKHAAKLVADKKAAKERAAAEDERVAAEAASKMDWKDKAKLTSLYDFDLARAKQWWKDTPTRNKMHLWDCIQKPQSDPYYESITRLAQLAMTQLALEDV